MVNKSQTLRLGSASMTVMDWILVVFTLGGAVLGSVLTAGIFLGKIMHRLHILERDYRSMQERMDRLFNGRH